jgi:uncharacterized protein
MRTSLEIPRHEVQRRLAMDNPWWQAGRGLDGEEKDWPRRSYYAPFEALARDRSVRRAVVLIGPRRVGKTVILRQFVQGLVDSGVRGIDILYLSLDTPLYAGRSLESLVQLFNETHRHEEGAQTWVLFDEIQYLKDWGLHLKSLVDSYPDIRFIASGSAAAALKMKSRESGAGRFTEFVLPPLTFAEFLKFTGREAGLILPSGREGSFSWRCADIEALNREFVDYLNYGGFPEAVLNQSVRSNPSRFLLQDVVDKVLLKDLPSLYGIADTQDLNRFFNVLAFNSGNELGLEALSSHSGIGKQRLADYLEYLEAAYLVRRVHRIDDNAERLQRARTFKVYLTNPSMRAALFGFLTAEDEALGSLAETAIWSQHLHRAELSGGLHYARWKEGRADLEVDIVALDRGTQKPSLAVEVKWSDRIVEHPEDLDGILALARKHPFASDPIVTTRTATELRDIRGVRVEFIPTALYCYAIAKDAS